MIILKVTKKQQQGFALSLENTFFEKPQGELEFYLVFVIGAKRKTYTAGVDELYNSLR